jgi:predicted nucleic acid-binding protein
MAEREASSRVVVCDAGPLIHLDELACLELLADFTETLVPSVVWNEVEHHRPAALTNQRVPLQRIVSSGRLPADLHATARLFALDQGEVRALHVARSRSADMLLTDDTAARLAARALNIPVHGTIGVLLRSIRRGRSTANEVVMLLQSIPTSSSLHIRQSL